MWAAAIDEDDDPRTLEVVATRTGQRRRLDSWDHELQGGKRRIAIRRVELDDLPERLRQPAELQRAGAPVASATLGTLPRALPGLEDRPFTILLGSCFAQKRDGGGTVGRTYSLLPGAIRPDLKILCGDQVYLDAPSFWTIFPAVTEGELKRRLLATYLEAWTQEPGFHTLLADGPNLFSADDHDFWNNAPKGSVTAPATLIPRLRRIWLAEATALYRAFQRPAEPRLTFVEMDGLSVCVTDARTNRTETDERFMAADDLADIRTWVGSLRAPGCLVLGQTLFAARAGSISRHMDLGLPDYAQYAELLDILGSARHSIVVLTGDVHFGRVAVCELAGGQEIIEVVASPLALVAPVPSNAWKAAPGRFPADPLPGRRPMSVTTVDDYQYNGNHFATIAFSRAGGHVQVHVQAWPTTNTGLPPVPLFSFERQVS